MKATTLTSTVKRIFTAVAVLLITVCLSVPAYAKDASIEPDGFTGETSSTVSISHDDGDATETTDTSENAVVSGPARDELRSEGSGGPTLTSFFYRLWSFFIRGG